jgi:hypothetical protein
MKLLPVISKGQAHFRGENKEELRCAAPRLDKPGWTCRKLIAKRNEHGQIAGDFRCERCGQSIQVSLVAAEENPRIKK